MEAKLKVREWKSGSASSAPSLGWNFDGQAVMKDKLNSSTKSGTVLVENFRMLRIFVGTQKI